MRQRLALTSFRKVLPYPLYAPSQCSVYLRLNLGCKAAKFRHCSMLSKSQRSNLMLADKITVHSISKESPEPEDIFSSALTSLFPDDTRNQHGDPQSLVTYHPRRFGDIKLTVADPVSEDDRRLFAHALWNASIWLAEAISGAEFIENGEIKNKLWKTEQAMSVFAMGGEKVLELGAGV